MRLGDISTTLKAFRVNFNARSENYPSKLFQIDASKFIVHWSEFESTLQEL